MAYTPIAKLDNFTSKEDDTQDTTNLWYQSLINKPQDFNVFKVEFLRYFSNNNSINCLVNIFTTIKQEETEAVTTYLGCFHQNLHQIQAINTNYFTAPQILNQFIYGLHSNILQHVCSLHPGTLQDAITCARDFESTKSEANHTQAVNLVINRSSELNSKLEKFITPEDATSSNLESDQQTTLTNNIPPATVTNDGSLAVIFLFELEKPSQLLLFSGAILEEKPITVMYTNVKVDEHSIKLILDNGSAGSIITKQFIDQLSYQVDRAASARIITADGTTRMLIGKIDNFPIEVNSIITPIKVLVMEATQYQALVSNNWLVKTNAVLNWTTQELQLS
ncbi:hypothetical protein G9A89_017792 [Geosiphon pyriformis]|nr:hypothetical protein G9A89_017792 [Geosiphon pyriformis]